MNCKVYVDVIAFFDKDGHLIPKTITWEDGHRYTIDKILDLRRAASLKAGGTGMRYTVRIHGRETFLFFEHNRWFVERKEA